MANVGSKGIVRYEENWATPNFATSAANPGVTWLYTKDTNDTAFVRAVVAGYGLHLYGVEHGTSADRMELLSDTLMFTGQEGYAAVEILVQFSSVANHSFFFGFNDAVTGPSNILPVSLSTTVFTNNAADGCIGIVYDTDADNDELHCYWANAATKTTTATSSLRMTGLAPTAAKWLWMRVEMQDRGSGNGVRATFTASDHTGKSVSKEFNTSVDRDLPLNYYFGSIERSTTGRNIYIKQCAWETSIADM